MRSSRRVAIFLGCVALVTRAAADGPSYSCDKVEAGSIEAKLEQLRTDLARWERESVVAFAAAAARQRAASGRR